VIIGTALLLTAIILEIITSTLNKFGLEKITYQALFIIPFILIELLIIYKIFKGTRWARNLYLIIFAIGLFDYIIQLIPTLTTNPLIAITSITSRIAALTAFIYLFKDPASEWFEPKEKPKNKHTKKLLAIIPFIFLLAVILIFVYIINPQELINKIGLQNGYILAFISAFFGGFSSATAATFYGIFAALISGGLNPIYLGLIGGIALSLGDMLIFQFGNQGRKLATGKIDQEIKYITSKIKKHNLEKFIPITAFIYLAATPLPNDWLLLFLAAIEYSPRKTRIIIILGDITLYTILVSQGITLF
jgi:hypothetical protein